MRLEVEVNKMNLCLGLTCLYTVVDLIQDLKQQDLYRATNPKLKFRSLFAFLGGGSPQWSSGELGVQCSASLLKIFREACSTSDGTWASYMQKTLAF